MKQEEKKTSTGEDGSGQPTELQQIPDVLTIQQMSF